MKQMAWQSCLVLLILTALRVSAKTDCNKRTFDQDSFVCVCDENSCDDFPTVRKPPNGSYLSITSSRDELRFHSETAPLYSNSSLDEADATIFINSSELLQSMIGFGGAFTDAAGINVATLSKSLQEILIRQYFSPDGIEYNIGRMPIAGCDFSTRPYSYDDVEGDTNLTHFGLAEEDYLYKIPMMKKAVEVGRRPLKLYGTPWSPPSWMKTNGMFNGSGGLLPEMQQPWANYFVKFLDAYKAEGLDFWGLTIQNEPSLGVGNFWWNACHFSPDEEKDFVRYFLGPTLYNAGYGEIKMIIGDDNRYIYPDYIEQVLSDEKCSSYVNGIGVHWYTDSFTPVTILDEMHLQYPDKFLLYTEASNGDFPSKDTSVELGSWERSEKYAMNIIENVNHWVTGWTDWNMVLDRAGGPSWVSNSLDAPIITNGEINEFYKQPTFYVMGHFSKLVPEQSRRVATRVDGQQQENKSKKKEKIHTVAFEDPENFLVLVILNRYNAEKLVTIRDSSRTTFQLLLPAKSIKTIIYKP